MEHSDVPNFVAGVIGRRCKPSKWRLGPVPGAFQYFSHMNSYERYKTIFKNYQFFVITGIFFAKN